MDFRFGKKLSGERTFTICGMADSLAPEIVQGKGHGLPADWYAVHIPHKFRSIYALWFIKCGLHSVTRSVELLALNLVISSSMFAVHLLESSPSNSSLPNLCSFRS